MKINSEVVGFVENEAESIDKIVDLLQSNPTALEKLTDMLNNSEALKSAVKLLEDNPEVIERVTQELENSMHLLDLYVDMLVLKPIEIIVGLF